MSFKNKYLVAKSYSNIVFISLKDIVINKSIALVKNSDGDLSIANKDESKIWYLAKFVPDKILNVIVEEGFSEVIKDCWYEEGFDEEIKNNIRFEIKDDGIYHFSFYFTKEKMEDGTIRTLPKEKEDIILLTGFIDENYNAPFLLEFDSDETAQLYMEANKGEWTSNNRNYY